MRIEINPAGDRAVFRQIADQIRAAIGSGELKDGDKLPSETEIMQMTGVARMTVRQGLQILQNERLIQAERGRGVFVRKPAAVVRMGTERFSPEFRGRSAGAFAAEAERLGLPWRQELRGIEPLKPSPELAAKMGLGGAAKALVRRRRMWLDSRPVQIADSYYPLALVRNTKIATEDTGPGGSYARLEEMGVRLAHAREELSVRTASASECSLLHLSAGIPVIHLVRTVTDDQGEVVELFDSVCVGENYVFAYDVPLR